MAKTNNSRLPMQWVPLTRKHDQTAFRSVDRKMMIPRCFFRVGSNELDALPAGIIAPLVSLNPPKPWSETPIATGRFLRGATGADIGVYQAQSTAQAKSNPFAYQSVEATGIPLALTTNN